MTRHAVKDIIQGSHVLYSENPSIDLKRKFKARKLCFCQYGQHNFISSKSDETKKFLSFIPLFLWLLFIREP